MNNYTLRWSLINSDESENDYQGQGTLLQSICILKPFTNVVKGIGEF